MIRHEKNRLKNKYKNPKNQLNKEILKREGGGGGGGGGGGAYKN